jgi:SpoIID/LytB domain protein
VRDTRGEVILFAGVPIQALYFSSSGGRTANAIDVFGNDIPYLVSVDDPWDDPSPHHAWAAQTFTGSSLAKALGVAGKIVDATVVAGVQGAPAHVDFTNEVGSTISLKLTEVRAKMGLKSSSFRLGMLRLARPAGARTTKPVELSGVARDVDSPQLQRLNAAGLWATGPKLAVAPDGTFTVVVRPAGKLTVRLVATDVIGAPLTIPAVGSTP